MKTLMVLAVICLILAAIFLIVYFGVTLIAIFLSILFNPVTWLILAVLGIFLYMKKKR